MTKKKMKILSSKDLNQTFNTSRHSKWNTLFGKSFGIEREPLLSSDIEEMMNFILEDLNEGKKELKKNDQDHISDDIKLVRTDLHHSFYSPQEEDHMFVFEKEIKYKK